MTDAHASNLTQYGYDCVVAVTQSSINANLLEYFGDNPQQVVHVCWIWDENNNLKQITLDTLKHLTGGINPFDINPDTPVTDPRIQKLVDVFFHSAYVFQPGLPKDVLPTELPTEMVVLGDSANNVKFTMYFSQFTVVQYTEAQGHSRAKWDVWSQSTANPWTIQTTVSLVAKDLDVSLDTLYFANNPVQKQNILSQFQNVSSSAFSLQQLLFDFEHAPIPDSLTFPFVKAGTPLRLSLGDTFAKAYAQALAERGEPVIAVQAVATTSDPSPLRITSIDRMVNPVINDNGSPILSPSADQEDAVTLNYLCMADNKPFKGGSTFAWNWVEPSNIGSADGTIAISRATICDQLLTQLLPMVRPYCFTSVVDSTGYALAQGGEPQFAAATASGKDIINIQFDNDSGLGKWKDGSSTWSTRMQPGYRAQVTVEGSVLTLYQTAFLQLDMRLDHSKGSVEYRAVASSRTRTDLYNIAVGQDGNLSAIYSSTSGVKDILQGPDGDVQHLIGEQWSEVQGAFVKTLDRVFLSIAFTSVHNFVFPGAKVFSYKDARFSDNQDLISTLTYQKVTDGQFQPPAPALESVQKSSQISSKDSGTFLSTEPVKQLTYSTELIQNYLHAETIPAEGKFEALQTDRGHTLLFSVSANGVLNVIEETSGTTSTGWVLTDLSTPLLQGHSGDQAPSVRTYDVAQSVVDGTVNLAMVVKGPQDGIPDSLYYLSASNSDTSWIQNPNWRQLIFDDPKGPSTITISGVLFSETADGRQYLIADIDGSAVGAAKDVRRYFLDLDSPDTPLWKQHDLPANIENTSYQSCVGRIPKGRVDGVYTAGSQAGSGQLVYVPMKNVFSKHNQPPVTKFELPQGLAASAIASARVGDLDQPNSDDYLSTDLYAVSGSSIYLFAAADQFVSPVTKSTAIINSSVVTGTTKLLCQVDANTTTLWGLTESKVVYYISCPVDRVYDPTAWSPVNPILNGVEHISAYMNRVDRCNTIFSAGGGVLRQTVQATATKSKLWRTHEIILVAQPEKPSLPINSYTTTVQALNSLGAPVGMTKLSVSAKSRTPVYINGLYYILKPTPITVYTDSAGLITIIERIQDLSGSLLTVSSDDGLISTVINPFEIPFNKLTDLNTTEKLTSATMPINLKAGGILGKAGTRELCKGSPDVLAAVATNLGVAQQAYNSFKNPKTFTVATQSDQASMSFLGDWIGAIEVEAGDLLQIAKNTWDNDIVPGLRYLGDKISEGWHMFLSVGGQLIHAAIIVIEDAVAVVSEIIKKAVQDAQDFLDYLKVLFDWNDITRTKKVVAKIFNSWMEDKVQDIRNFKTYLDDHLKDAETKLLEVAKITDWSIPGDTMLSNNPSPGPNNPHKGQTSASSLLARHYRNHAQDSNFQSDSPFSGLENNPTLQGLIQILSNTVEAEANTISSAYSEIQDLCQTFSSMTVEKFFVKVLSVLGVAVLDSVKNIIDALLDILVLLAETIIQDLNRKIHIPVLSHILNELGIPDFSLLDVFFYIMSAFVTIPYKIAHDGKAPYPDNDDTQRIISAASWTDLTALFGQSSAPQTLTADPTSIIPTIEDSSTRAITNGVCHIIICVSEWLSDVAGTSIASQEPGEAPTATNVASGVFGATSGALNLAIDNLVPKCPIQHIGWSIVNGVSGVCRVFVKIVCSGPGQAIFKGLGVSSLQIDAGPRASVGAVLDAVLTAPTMLSSIVHFVEMSKVDATYDRSVAIIEEVSNISAFVQRICYAVCLNDFDPDTRAAFLIVYIASSAIIGGLQFSIAWIN